MVSTGLQNNQIFPTLLISLAISILSTLYNIYNTVTNLSSTSSTDPLASTSSVELLLAVLPVIPLLLFPLIVGLWGASLFKPDGTGAGFTASANNAATSMMKKD
jgi:hypothetical protein